MKRILLRSAGKDIMSYKSDAIPRVGESIQFFWNPKFPVPPKGAWRVDSIRYFEDLEKDTTDVLICVSPDITIEYPLFEYEIPKRKGAR